MVLIVLSMPRFLLLYCSVVFLDRGAGIESYNVSSRLLNERCLTLNTQVHRMSIAMIDIIDKIDTSEPLGRELESLKTAAQDDVVVKGVLTSLPARLASVGVPTMSELESRFGAVHDTCQKLALLPTEGGGVLQYALANIVQVLSLKENGIAKGEDAEAVLSRAKYYMDEKRDLESAVKEFEKLPKQIQEQANDWIGT